VRQNPECRNCIFRSCMPSGSSARLIEAATIWG
jgi:hypothetical protein